jgi:HK97 family phage portal protein
MFERFKSRFRKKALSILQLFGGMFASVPTSQLTNFDSYLRAGTGQIWALWKGCDIVAQTVMDTPTTLINQRTQKPIENAEIAKLLRYPNPYQTFAELVYLTAMQLKLTGNAFWLKDAVNRDGKRPSNLWSLNPKRMTIVTGNGRDNQLIERYEYQAAGQVFKLRTEEVLHFKRPHPNNDYWGLGDVEAGQELFQDFMNRTDWSGRFWGNGASPSGILINETDLPIDRDEWQKVKARWQAEYGGSKNAGKTAWINGKWRYERLGLSAQEMEDMEKTKLSVEQIFILLGVPLSVAGVREAANYATAAIDDQRFRRYTVKPMVKILSDTINTDLIPDWGELLELRWNISGLVNTGAIVQDFAPLFDRGVISINEFRERCGLERIDEELFNQHFINAGLVPLDLSGVADMGQLDQQARRISERFVAEALGAPSRNGHPAS